jgi:asparagine synthase (glutamine-hydrolysing)
MAGEGARLESVQAMTRRLAHRGPDGEGFWGDAHEGAVLGHRRLAIQDLSPSGAQPMVHGAHVLSYNGELYNHEALRATLEGPWHSTGDTEVVLHLLAREGCEGLSRLAGMFALALWDRQARRLLLVRDRLGIKPLYYRVSAQGIAFASELKALLVLGAPPIDRSAVRDFLFHGYVPAPKSIYEGIAKLPAGHWLSFEAGRVRIERYWRPRVAVSVRAAPEALEALDARLREVVPAHTVSDVPVGVFLSGGLDSALTTYYLDRPHTFSLGLESRDRSELAAARATALHLHTHHTEIMAPAADFESALERLPSVFDEPFGDSAAWSNYLIAECARREVRGAMRSSAAIRATGRRSERARAA